MKHSTLGIAAGGRRRRATTEERQHWIEAWERSQQTQAAFAAKHGLSVATLRNWLRRAASQGAQQPVRPKFVEVVLGGLGAKQPSAGSPAWEFEISTPRGWVVSVAPATPIERLQAVLEAVGC